MKKYLILLLSLFILSACVKDTSDFEKQQKENVNVDRDYNDDEGDDVTIPGWLSPGIHLVKINMPMADGSTTERRFKYFMPVSINPAKPISLIFNFHGSYVYKEGATPPDPLMDVRINHVLNQHAIRNNCIIIFPAGEAIGTAVNWQNSKVHLPFVDSMLNYMSRNEPRYDPTRVYTCGHSSGAIFSYVLAFERSTVFAAAVPVAGQMSLTGQTTFPDRAVPIRAFNGVDDDIVIHSAVLNNITVWAEKVGGYFNGDMVQSKDTIKITNYKPMVTRKWNGAKADIELFSVIGTGHSVSWGYIMPYMWEFMSSHTLTSTTPPLFITSETKEIVAEQNQQFNLRINYSDGATITHNAPADWNPVLNGKTLALRSPADFFNCQNRKGVITIKVTKDGIEKTLSISYKLNAPKNYFEVGDIYYNTNFEPVGVVVWVNNANIREAKIINLAKPGAYGTLYYSGNVAKSMLGLSFQTPNPDDGEGNTAAMMTQNTTLAIPNTASTSLWVWASTYNYKGVTGWYLPALNELSMIKSDLTDINKSLTALGATLMDGVTYSSTVVVDGVNKNYKAYNFTTGMVITTVGTQAKFESIGYISGRAMKRVTK